MTSPDGINWTSQSNLPIAYISDITCGNGTYVAVSNNGNVAYSNNGINWTIPTAPSRYWNAITYGNNKYVAMSSSGYSMYSSDGITWTEVSTPNNSYTSVTYGNGLYVAVVNNSSHYITTSSDGITWTNQSFSSFGLISVCFGNGKFVSVSPYNNTTPFIYSSDGLAWTIPNINTAFSTQLSSYGNGVFVLANQYNPVYVQFQYSTDCINWSLVSLNVQNMRISCISYVNNQFIALGNDNVNTYMFNSNDGISWSYSNLGIQGYNWNSLTYGNSTYVAVLEYNYPEQVLISTDGINWSLQYSSDDSNWLSVTFGNGIFVSTASGGSNQVMTSTDGISWSSVSVPSDGWYQVAYGNGLFVAFSLNNYTIIYGTDGTNWTYIPSVDLPNVEYPVLNSITYGPEGFVICGYYYPNPDYYTTPFILTSSDGITWTFSDTNISNGAQIVYGNYKYLITGDYGLYSIGSTTSPPPICYNKGTKILCDNNEYKNIEDLKVGDYVKTYLHGNKKISYVGSKTMVNNPSSWKHSMYKMSKDTNPELTDDLIVTAFHSILTKTRTVEERKKYIEYKLGYQFIDNRKIDNCLLTIAAVSDKFTQITDTNEYTYYHFVLEDANPATKFGVYANGILSESLSLFEYNNKF
jgi:Hint domain